MLPLLVPIGLAAATVAKRAIPHIGKQWGRPRIGVLKATKPIVSPVGIAGGIAGEVIEDTSGVNLPEVVPSTLIGAGLYKAANILNGMAIKDNRLIDRENILDQNRILENVDALNQIKRLRDED